MNKSNRELSAEQRAAEAALSLRLTIGPRILKKYLHNLDHILNLKPSKLEPRTAVAAHIIDHRNTL